MADNTYPFALDQCSHDVGADGHTADLFNIATRNRLLVSHQRQGFEQRTGIAWWLFLPETTDPLAIISPHLETVARGDLLQFIAPALAVRFDLFQDVADRCAFRFTAFFKQSHQLIDRQRLFGCQDRSFDNLLER